MDEATLQAILDSLPPKESRSRLEPYGVLIAELRRRGRSYKEIAQVLAEKCQVKVAPSTIFDFVQVRAKAKPKVRTADAESRSGSPQAATTPTNAAASAPPEGKQRERGVEERIASLKQRPISTKVRKPVFTYEEEEPLKLKPGAKDLAKE
jgi:IS30 family transposase